MPGQYQPKGLKPPTNLAHFAEHCAVQNVGLLGKQLHSSIGVVTRRRQIPIHPIYPGEGSMDRTVEKTPNARSDLNRADREALVSVPGIARAAAESSRP